jgi:hypothetical protein
MTPSPDAEVGDGLLEASIAGMLPRAATAGQAHSLRLNLRRRGGVLVGYVSASASLGDRPFFVIPFPVCLERRDLRPAAPARRATRCQN